MQGGHKPARLRLIKWQVGFLLLRVDIRPLSGEPLHGQVARTMTVLESLVEMIHFKPRANQTLLQTEILNSFPDLLDRHVLASLMCYTFSAFDPLLKN